MRTDEYLGDQYDFLSFAYFILSICSTIRVKLW